MGAGKILFLDLGIGHTCMLSVAIHQAVHICALVHIILMRKKLTILRGRIAQWLRVHAPKHIVVIV